MGLIDKLLLRVTEVGANSTLIRRIRGMASLADQLVPGMEGAEHLFKNFDEWIEQTHNILKNLHKRRDIIESSIKPDIAEQSTKLINESHLIDKATKKVRLPEVSSALPFDIHNSATGNAVTRRTVSLKKVNTTNRSRALRYGK